MTEYIDRDKTIDDLRRDDVKTPSENVVNQYEKGYADGKRDAIKQGGWIDHQDCVFTKAPGRYKCSICRARYDYDPTAWNFCPNCGARMNGFLSDDRNSEEEG